MLRSGDLSQASRVRVDSHDLSAKAGIDYEPISQLLVFGPDIEVLPVHVKLLHRLTRTKILIFSLLLSLIELNSAELGEKSSVTIKMKQGINRVIMKVLPTQPILVSLLDYDSLQSVSQHSVLSPGYPLICVSACDAKHPKFSSTRALCESADINESSIDYSWEVALHGVTTFKPIMVSTIFGSVNNRVLDPLFFATNFKVQCKTTTFTQTAQGLKLKGITLRSNSVTIGGRNEALCSQEENSFVAVLKYVDSSQMNQDHKNTIHVHLEIPHSDGMLPLVSTQLLSNPHRLILDRRLSVPHKCSNLYNSSAFSNRSPMPSVRDAGFSRPYQLSREMRGSESVMLYKHLNLATCTWKFDAWLHMTQLVDDCGGVISPNFQVCVNNYLLKTNQGLV